MRAAGRPGDLEYASWVFLSYRQAALAWPLPFAAFILLLFFSDIRNLWNVTMCAPLLALCLYQYYVTRRGLTLQVRTCWRLQCIMAAYIYAHFLSGAVRAHPIAIHGDIICNLYATVPQQLFSMMDSLPSFTTPLFILSHVLALSLQHIWLTGHRWPIALARSIAVHTICLAVYIKLARHCQSSYQAMVQAQNLQPLHKFSPKSSIQEVSCASAKSQMGEGKQKEGLEEPKCSGPEVSTPSGEQLQSDVLWSQQQQQQQEQPQQQQQQQQQLGQQLEQIDQQLMSVERALMSTAGSGPGDADADYDAVQLCDASSSVRGMEVTTRRPYRSRRTHLQVSLTLQGALSPEMMGTEAINELVLECERLCPCFVLDLAVRGGCVVLSFDISVLRDKEACKAVCNKVLTVTKDWVRAQGIQDPGSKSSPLLVAQAWDYFTQIKEVASDASNDSGAPSIKSLKPRLTLPTPSLLMPPPPPRALIAAPGSHRRSTEAHTTWDLEVEVWLSMAGGMAPDWEVLGWEGRKDSPEEDGHAEEGACCAAQHMRLLACTQGRFLAVRVLGCEQKGAALVLKVHVALPTHLLAAKGCSLGLQLWRGGCMLCSTIAALLPHSLADTHTELNTWVSHEQQMLLQQRQLLLQRKQLLLQQRQALLEQQQQQAALQELQREVLQLEQLERGPDLGVQEFLADLSEWLMFHGGHSNSSSRSSTCTSLSTRNSSSTERLWRRHSGSKRSTNGGSLQQLDAVCMMRDVGLDLLLHSLHYGLEKFSVVLLRGLASPPFNLTSADIAAEPAFQEDPATQSALAAAAAATAAAASEAPSMAQVGNLGEKEPSKQQQHQERQQQQQQSVKAAEDRAGLTGCAESMPAPSATQEKRLGAQPTHAPSYLSWLVGQHRLLVARWALFIVIGCTIHALHPKCMPNALPYFVAGALLGTGVIFAALRNMHKQVQLLVLCLAALQVACVHSLASAAESPFLLLLCYGLDVCAHLCTTVPYLLLLEPSLPLLPLLPMANVISNAKLYQHVAGHALPLAFLQASALQALSLAVYTIIRKKARAGFAAHQATARPAPKPTGEHACPSEPN